MAVTLPTRVGIVTQSGEKLKYDAPSRTCVTIDACTGWERATKLLYSRVPAGQNVVFYSDVDCTGVIVFNSEVGKTFGNEIVKGDRGIVRSFILAKYTYYPVKGIISKCRDESGLVLNATVENNETEWTSASTQSSFYDGNLSTNWFYSLPNGEVAVGDA